MPLPFRSLLLAAALLTCAGAVRAQVAVYANFEGNDLRQANTFLYGGTFGLYDDFYKLGPLRIGADVRGASQSSGDLNYVKILGGLRVAAKPPILPIKPYAQISAGPERENAGSLKGSYHVGYEVNGGVDLTFLPHLDWRIAEIGGGNFGSATENQFHIATGLVLRFF